MKTIQKIPLDKYRNEVQIPHFATILSVGTEKASPDTIYAGMVWENVVNVFLYILSEPDEQTAPVMIEILKEGEEVGRFYAYINSFDYMGDKCHAFWINK